MSERWIRCVECNQVVRMTPFDGLPSYAYDEGCGDFIETAVDDGACFVGQHKQHPLEELFIIKGSFISEGRYGEPLKVNYFEASNGKERFVIRGFRQDITRPMEYELIPGYIETSFRRAVQSKELRRQLEEEITDPPLSEVQVERFIKTVEQVAVKFPPQDGIEITAETDTPLISHCKLGCGAIGEILSRCREFLDDLEIARLRKFIDDNNSYNEPMTLLLKRTFRIRRAHTVSWKGETEASALKTKAAQHS